MKNALGVSLGILALVWTYLALTVLSGYVLVWAGFVAWGAYFVVGGKSALADTITAMIYGSIMAGVAVVIMTLLDDYLDLPLAAAIAVGITVWALTIIPKLKNITANVFGYAATFALIVQSMLTNLLASEGAEIISLSLGNPIVLASLSFIGGPVFGLLSEKLAAKLG